MENSGLIYQSIDHYSFIYLVVYWRPGHYEDHEVMERAERVERGEKGKEGERAGPRTSKPVLRAKLVAQGASMFILTVTE